MQAFIISFCGLMQTKRCERSCSYLFISACYKWLLFSWLCMKMSSADIYHCWKTKPRCVWLLLLCLVKYNLLPKFLLFPPNLYIILIHPYMLYLPIPWSPTSSLSASQSQQSAMLCAYIYIYIFIYIYLYIYIYIYIFIYIYLYIYIYIYIFIYIYLYIY